MRRRLALLSGACACALGVLASAQAPGARQHGAAPPQASGTARPAQSAPARRPERRVPFAAGETLAYDVSWSSYLTAGTATLSVKEKRPSFGSVAYYLVAEGQPTPLLSALYTLYYKADSLLDAYSLLSQRGSLYSQEGRRRRMASTRFDQAARTARYEVRTATVVTKDLQVPPSTQDPLSAIYVIRTLPLRPSLKVTMPVVDRDEIYRVQITVTGRERVTTPFGDLPAWRIAPAIVGGGALQGAFVLWISDDPRRLPLKLEAEMPVGRFVLSLREAKG
jgi:hypothetical protein